MSITEVLELHRRVIAQSGGSPGVRDSHALLSAIAQPRQTFDAQDLYVTVADKAAALAYFLCRNHPFIDGNKRIAHAALEVMLVLNGYELDASVDEQERVMLQLATGDMRREAFTEWVRSRVKPFTNAS